MTALDHATSAFENLWETKIHLLRCADQSPADLQPAVREAAAEAAVLRNKLEQLVIALQGPLPPVAGPPQG